jgi:hypothetical protein
MLGAAILLSTALVLFFTNSLFRRTFLGVTILAFIAGGVWFLYVSYVQTPAEEAARRHAAEALKAEDARFIAAVRDDVLEDGRWLPVALDGDHRQYLVDTETIEMRSGVVPCGWRQLFPDDHTGAVQARRRYVRVWIRVRTPPEVSGVQDKSSRAAFSCDGEESCGDELADPNGWRSAPGSVAETILRRLQGSTWCGKLDAVVRDPAFLKLSVEEQLKVFRHGDPTLKLKSEKEQQDFLSLKIAAAREDERRGAAAPKSPAQVSGPQSTSPPPMPKAFSTQEQTPSASDSPRRTEDGGYAYVFNSAPYGHPSRKLLVKTTRLLSATERSGMLDRLKIKCPGVWMVLCEGKLDDGASYRSEILAE